MTKHLNLRAIIALGLVFAFLANTLGPIPIAQAQEFSLPQAGAMILLSPEYNPPILKGIKVHTDNPFKFDFILDQGDKDNRHSERSEGSQQEQLKIESTRLIKYFLASITIPDQDLWVNLSPYEKTRVIPNSFGLTEMGRDLLAEDYMLKQITASLIYPENKIGKKFWDRIYQEAEKKLGTTNIPVNTFNKVWIVPEKAVVYENAKAGTAYIVESHLKVMLEQDYLSLQKHGVVHDDFAAVGANIVREIVIPELTREVNEDKNFAQLRQVYNSLILATWYKKKIKDSILAQVYENKNKVKGVEYSASVIGKRPRDADVELIYQRYLQAFKKGVFNYIKDTDTPEGGSILRKYFSGGFDGPTIARVETFITNDDSVPGNTPSNLAMVSAGVDTFEGVRHTNRVMSVRSAAVLVMAIIATMLPTAISREPHLLKPNVQVHKATPLEHAVGLIVHLGGRKLEEIGTRRLKGVGILGDGVEIKNSLNFYPEYKETDEDALLVVGVKNYSDKPQEIKLQVGQAASKFGDGNNMRVVAKAWMRFQDNSPVNLYVLGPDGKIKEGSTKVPTVIPAHGMVVIPNGPYDFNSKTFVTSYNAITEIKTKKVLPNKDGNIGLKIVEMVIRVHHPEDIKQDLPIFIKGPFVQLKPLSWAKNLRDDYDGVSPKSLVTKPINLKGHSHYVIRILSKTDHHYDGYNLRSTYGQRIYFILVNADKSPQKVMAKIKAVGGPAAVYVFNSDMSYFLHDYNTAPILNSIILPPKGKKIVSFIVFDGGNFPLRVEIKSFPVKTVQKAEPSSSKKSSKVKDRAMTNVGELPSGQTIYRADSIEKVQKGFQESLMIMSMIPLSDGRKAADVFHLDSRMTYLYARDLEKGLIVERQFSLTFFEEMEEYRRLKSLSRAPNQDEHVIIQKAVSIVQSYAERHGLPFKDFSGQVSFIDKKKYLRSEGLYEYLSQEIFVLSDRNDDEKLKTIVHEAFHSLCKGFPVTWLNEGLTDYLTIQALMESERYSEPDQLRQPRTGTFDSRLFPFAKGSVSKYIIDQMPDYTLDAYYPLIILVEQIKAQLSKKQFDQLINEFQNGSWVEAMRLLGGEKGVEGLENLDRDWFEMTAPPQIEIGSIVGFLWYAKSKVNSLLSASDGAMNHSSSQGENADAAMGLAFEIIDDNDVVFSEPGFDAMLRDGHSEFRIFKEEYAMKDWPEKRKRLIVKNKKGETKIVYLDPKQSKSRNYTGFTLEKKKFLILAEFMGWKVKPDIPMVSGMNDVVFSGPGFGNELRSGEAIWVTFSQEMKALEIMNAEDYPYDVKKVPMGDFELVRKYAGNEIVFTLDKETFYKLAELKGWKRKPDLPIVSRKNDVVFSSDGFGATLRNGYVIWSKFDKEMKEMGLLDAEDYPYDCKKVPMGEFELVRKYSGNNIVFTLDKQKFRELVAKKDDWRFRLPKVEDDDVVFSRPVWIEFLLGGGRIYNEFKEKHGIDAEKYYSQGIERVKLGKFILELKESGARIACTLNLKNFRELAQMHGWEFRYADVKNDEVILSEKGFMARFANGKELWLRFKDAIGQQQAKELKSMDTLKIGKEDFGVMRRISDEEGVVPVLSLGNFKELASTLNLDPTFYFAFDGDDPAAKDTAFERLARWANKNHSSKITFNKLFKTVGSLPFANKEYLRGYLEKFKITLADSAMSLEDYKGGIDFTANKTPLEIQNGEQGIQFHLDPAMLARFQNTSGFVPVVFDIQPMTNLRAFLGIAN